MEFLQFRGDRGVPPLPVVGRFGEFVAGYGGD